MSNRTDLDNVTAAWRAAQEQADRCERDLREILDALPERGEFARPAVEQILDLVAALERIATYDAGAVQGYEDEWIEADAYERCKEIARAALGRTEGEYKAVSTLIEKVGRESRCVSVESFKREGARQAIPFTGRLLSCPSCGSDPDVDCICRGQG